MNNFRYGCSGQLKLATTETHLDVLLRRTIVLHFIAEQINQYGLKRI
ncbi:hypothetical protein DN38_2980 [Vibrio cholerae]|nr:hypothetical protein DN38_2980 [Vibrio cholerae]